MPDATDARIKVISLAIEMFMIRHYRTHSVFQPKKETEENVRRFLEIGPGARCNDFLGVHRGSPDVWLLGDGKGRDVEGAADQFGATAAALLVAQTVSRIYFELFILEGTIPNYLLELLPAINEVRILGDNAVLNLLARAVAEYMELEPRSPNNVLLAKKPDGHYQAAGGTGYLLDPSGRLVRPALPAFPPANGRRFTPGVWQQLVNKLDLGIVVNFVRIRPQA